LLLFFPEFLELAEAFQPQTAKLKKKQKKLSFLRTIFFFFSELERITVWQTEKKVISSKQLQLFFCCCVFRTG
jgi:hypothetical protein